MATKDDASLNESDDALRECRRGWSPLLIVSIAAVLSLLLLAVVASEAWSCYATHAQLQETAENGSIPLTIDMLDAHRRRMGVLFGLVIVTAFLLLVVWAAAWMQIRKFLRHHRMSETALRQSHQRYHELFMRTPCALWEVDASALGPWFEDLRRCGVTNLKAWLNARREERNRAISLMRVVDINDATVTMFEADSKQQMLANPTAICTDETYDAVAELLDVFWRGLPRIILETSGRTFKGRPVYFLIRCFFPSSRGRPDLSRVVIATADITERRLAEAEIASLAKFPSENPHPILRITADGALLYANEASQAILADWRCSPGDPVPARWRQTIAEVLTDGRPHSIESRAADRVMSYTVVPVPERGYVNLYCRDVTGRANAERALQFRLDLEEHITRISTEFINLEPEEIDAAINRALADISDLACTDRSYVFLYAADGQSMSNTYEHCRRGIPPFRQTLQNVPISIFPWFQAQIFKHQSVIVNSVAEMGSEAAPEKKEFERESIQSLLCVPMVCKDRVMGFVGFDRVLFQASWKEEIVTLLKIVGTIFANALDRKAAEEERRLLIKTLAAKNDELQSIVYVASHDLKSPLVNIQGFSGELARTCEQVTRILHDSDIPEDVRSRIDPLLRQDVAESLRFISAGVAKMQSLLNGLLAVSRVGTAALRMQRLDMHEMMHQIIAAMQYQISESGAEVTVEALPDCFGDCDHINQVFSNLLSNAVKYFQPGRQGRIRISGRRQGVQVVYCVEDNGRGISPQHQGKVFDIFHRLEPDKTTGGEGLGLTIALRIVERHGGRIWIESELHKGSRFFVSLPAIV